jgi:hypothetical protein
MSLEVFQAPALFAIPLLKDGASHSPDSHLNQTREWRLQRGYSNKDSKRQRVVLKTYPTATVLAVPIVDHKHTSEKKGVQDVKTVAHKGRKRKFRFKAAWQAEITSLKTGLPYIPVTHVPEIFESP